MRRINFAVMVFLLVSFAAALLMVPGIAFAEATEVSGALAGLLTNTVFPIVAAVVMAMVGWAVTWAAKKWKLGFLLESEEYVQRLALSAVSFVEERTAKMVKESGVAVPGGEKLNMAVARIMHSAPEVGRDRAEELAESMLARLRGAGATGDKAL